MTINIHHVKTPIQIITTNLGIPEDYKQKCIQEAYKIGDQQNQQTNIKGIMSSYRVWEETNVYDKLIYNIKDTIDNKLSLLKDSRYEYFLTSTWTAIYKEGHYTINHDHLPEHVSFVYYLKAHIDSSPLVFGDSELQINPYDDLLVVFPSHLNHYVPEHEGEDRICLAGNLDIVYKE